MWVAALLACQLPFDVDRHDLVGFRVAALSAPATADLGALTPTAAVIVDGRAWAPSPVGLSWYWMHPDDDVADLDALAPPDGTGPAPLLTVPADRRRLALIARRPGEERRAFVDVASPPATVPRVSGFAVSDLQTPLDANPPPLLDLEARNALDGADATWVGPSGLLRMKVLLADGGDEAIVRWTSTAGTWFELDPTTADWASADLLLDEGEIDGAVIPLSPGPVTVIAIVVGAPGQTAFAATEVHVDAPGPGLWTQGRWLPTDAPVDPGPDDAVRGTLVAADDSPVGVVLTGATVQDAAEARAQGWGTDTLACLIAREGPFDPGWFLTQHCGRALADGHEVAVIPDPAP